VAQDVTICHRDKGDDVSAAQLSLPAATAICVAFRDAPARRIRGRFGTCHARKPAKLPTFNFCHFGAVIAHQVFELACKALNSRAAGPGCVFYAEPTYSVFAHTF